MSTTPVQPTPIKSQADLSAALLTQINTMTAHHAKFAWVLSGILVLVLGIASVGGYFGLKSYDKALQKAEAQEQAYNADRKAFIDTLAQHDAARAADAQQETQIIAGMAKRALQTPPPAVQAGLATTATGQQTETALELASGGRIKAQLGPDQALVLSQSDAKTVVSDELALTKSQADLKDEISLYTLEKKDNTFLTSDLNTCKSLNTEANNTISNYKKAAVKSKRNKIWGGIKMTAAVVIAFELGHKL